MEPKDAVMAVDEGCEEGDTTAVIVLVKSSEDIYNFLDSDDIKETSWAETFKAYADTQPIR